jgi:hypothetical protein
MKIKNLFIDEGRNGKSRLDWHEVEEFSSALDEVLVFKNKSSAMKLCWDGNCFFYKRVAKLYGGAIKRYEAILELDDEFKLGKPEAVEFAFRIMNEDLGILFTFNPEISAFVSHIQFNNKYLSIYVEKDFKWLSIKPTPEYILSRVIAEDAEQDDIENLF